MRPVDIKTINYRGSRASKRRGPGAKTWLMVAGVFVLLGALGYVLFYSPWLQVDSVAFQGVSEQHQEEVRPAIENVLDHKTLGLSVGRSMVLLKTSALKANLAEQFPFLKEVSVSKDYFHTLQISGTERHAEGVWCFEANSSSPRCQYFDQSGVLWGQAIQSSGVLFLNVDDARIASGSSSVVDPSFLKGIQTVISGLTEQNVKVKKIMIPADSFTEFDVVVSDPASLVGASGPASPIGGYSLKFSLDSDLPGQLKAYQIFKSQKLSAGESQPQYLDLRFDGRVYFK